MINGDDCGFQGRSLEKEAVKKPAIFPVWKKVTAFAGLESSVGKTFRSRLFIMINSEKFEYLDAEKTLEYALSNPAFMDKLNLDKLYHFVSKPYVNFGLVYGQSKDGIRDKGCTRMGPLHRDLYNTCPEKYFPGASELFMKINSDKIEKYKIPKFVPEWLGGLGLVPWRNKQVSEGELLVCTLLRQKLNGDVHYDCKGNLSGNTKSENFLKIQQQMEPKEWLLHNLAKDYIKEYKFLDQQFWERVGFDNTYRTLEGEWSKLYSSLICTSYLENGFYLKDYNAPEFPDTTEYRELNGLTREDPVSPDAMCILANEKEKEWKMKLKELNCKPIFLPMDKMSEERRTALCYAHNERAWEFAFRMIREESTDGEDLCKYLGHFKMHRKELLYEKKKGFLSCFDTRR